jgi:hypothetical protein
MANEGLPVERLREYFRELKPEARALLIAELERGRLQGEVPGIEVILEELRGSLPRLDDRPPPADNAIRYFFVPVEAFAVDDRPERKHQGRIVRTSLDPIWQWLSRDLMPTEVKAYSDQLDRFVATKDIEAAERLARAFQDRAVQRMREALSKGASDDKHRRRMAVQIGTPCAIEEITDLISILKARDALALLGQRLPAQIKNLADEQLENVKGLLDSPIGRSSHVFVYGLLLVMSRLVTPWQLIRLAVKAAETDVASKIAETNFAAAVSIVLADMERMVWHLTEELKRGDIGKVSRFLKDIHDCARTLRTELDLSADSPWSRQLAQLRSEISHLLEAQIASAPGRVRRLLRPRPAKEIAADSALDQIDVDETEATIELVAICRNFASELAINEATLRAYTELQAGLDSAMTPLIDALRVSGAHERKFRRSQVDAAVRFSAKIFGTNYASLYAKAADVAGHNESKVAKA